MIVSQTRPQIAKILATESQRLWEHLHSGFGVRFGSLESSEELHRTPFGTVQPFLYCWCRVEW